MKQKSMTRNWEGIVIHHSASPARVWSKETCRNLGVNDVRVWHINQNFGDIGYHYLIDGAGLIYKGRPLSQVGAHCSAAKRNYLSLGVCLMGNFQYEGPTMEQLSSLIILVRYLKEKYKIKDQMVEMHGKVEGASTLCPGKYFPEEYFYKEIKNNQDEF